MSELVSRLRRYAQFYSQDGWRARWTVCKALNEAADRIIRLEAENAALLAARTAIKESSPNGD